MALVPFFGCGFAALFGMATKYAEGLLAIKYRVITEDGHVLGEVLFTTSKMVWVKTEMAR